MAVQVRSQTLKHSTLDFVSNSSFEAKIKRTGIFGDYDDDEHTHTHKNNTNELRNAISITRIKTILVLI